MESDISSLEEEEEEEAQCSVVKVVVDVLLLILTRAVVFGYILTKNNRLSHDSTHINWCHFLSQQLIY